MPHQDLFEMFDRARTVRFEEEPPPQRQPRPFLIALLAAVAGGVGAACAFALIIYLIVSLA